MKAATMILLAAILIPGIIVKVKALTSGRKGPGLLQPMLDILRLLRKGSVYSTTSSIATQIAPTVYFISVFTALWLVPMGDEASFIHFSGDILVFTYMLGLGKFFLILNALDAGSGFEGMGANREAFYSLLAEPALLMLLGTFSMMTSYDSFSLIFAHWDLATGSSLVLAALAAYLLLQLSLIENSRLPVDDPKTHLELTMVHEVMVLDNSGFDLGIIQFANALKFGIFSALIANFLAPDREGVWEMILFGGIMLCYAVVVGLLESFRARFKMEKNPQFILTLTSVAALTFIVALIITNKLL
ncbi:MAG: NADH-quinone oxidoreductase subunit H [Cyclobacteriaceae bacterium]|nr:NADH-quinone oxidoreductase subunit H [Cyclobacteriaceae bacterium]